MTAHPRRLETMAPTSTGRAGSPSVKEIGPDADFRFHALLTPNRSLTAAGFYQVMAVIVAVNLVNGLIYLTVGAWPVAFFCAIDIMIVYAAFRLSYAQGRQHERLILTDSHLWVARVLPTGHESRWRLDPAAVRVEIDVPVEHESQLVLNERGSTLVVGSFLSPKERGEVAAALRAALRSRTTDRR
jgi:uncharacterized membrane protein